MSMFNAIELEKRGNEDSCTHSWQTSYEGKWDLCASKMVNDFENSGHPVFKGKSPLGRGILKKNNRDTFHFNEEYSNIDL